MGRPRPLDAPKLPRQDIAVRFVYEPGPDEAERWAAALAILLELGRSVAQGEGPTTEKPTDR